MVIYIYVGVCILLYELREAHVLGSYQEIPVQWGRGERGHDVSEAIGRTGAGLQNKMKNLTRLIGHTCAFNHKCLFYV